MRALVIGGSMSGLLAALALRRRGLDVSVYERVAEPLAGRGAGIVAQPELKAVMRKLGLDPDRDLGVEVPWRVMFSRDGRVTHRMEIPQTMTAWDRVFHLLKAAFPEADYHRGKELRRVEQGARRRRRISPTARSRRATSLLARTEFARPFASNSCPM